MKSKKIAKIVIIIILLILLIPIPFKLKDGGTVEWKSLTYSISKVNSIYSIDDIRMGYKKGVIIKIFNITVFNNSKYDIEKEFVIVDSSKNNENFTCASALEEIYKDDEYIYYLPCQKSQYIKVIYAPNEYQEGLKSSLEDGTIKINNDDAHLIIKYKKKKYDVFIVKDDDNYYWLLKPYNQSYYKTSVDFDNSNIDIVFFAIRENEDLYS